jgi:hypothetical protein
MCIVRERVHERVRVFQKTEGGGSIWAESALVQLRLLPGGQMLTAANRRSRIGRGCLHAGFRHPMATQPPRATACK